jgi:hypothetical protein
MRMIRKEKKYVMKVLFTRNVSEGSGEGDVLISVNDEGTSSELISSVSDLSLTSSDGLGVNNLEDIIVSTDCLEEGNSLLGLFDFLEGIIEDVRELLNVRDSVSSSKNERDNSGGSESGGDGVSLLLGIDSSVDSSVGLKRSEHSSLSALVTKGGLA